MTNDKPAREFEEFDTKPITTSSDDFESFDANTLGLKDDEFLAEIKAYNDHALFSSNVKRFAPMAQRHIHWLLKAYQALKLENEEKTASYNKLLTAYKTAQDGSVVMIESYEYNREAMLEANQKLKAENAELREAEKEAFNLAVEFDIERLDLQSEVARLREAAWDVIGMQEKCYGPEWRKMTSAIEIATVRLEEALNHKPKGEKE